MFGILPSDYFVAAMAHEVPVHWCKSRRSEKVPSQANDVYWMSTPTMHIS